MFERFQLLSKTNGLPLTVEMQFSKILRNTICICRHFAFGISFLCTPSICFFLSHLFLCPRDDSQGALRFAPVCPPMCLSVRPFVTLYGIEFV